MRGTLCPPQHSAARRPAGSGSSPCSRLWKLRFEGLTLGPETQAGELWPCRGIQRPSSCVLAFSPVPPTPLPGAVTLDSHDRPASVPDCKLRGWAG